MIKKKIALILALSAFSFYVSCTLPTLPNQNEDAQVSSILEPTVCINVEPETFPTPVFEELEPCEK